jgi:hypothetical protein
MPPSEQVPQSVGEEGDFSRFSTKNRAEGWLWVLTPLVVSPAAAPIHPQGAHWPQHSALVPGWLHKQWASYLLQCHSNKM